ncbi:MAG TPA: 16S rRNA (cytosine(1402)-N(4))-methyltransferase RsmH [Flavobacteriales bacterium]|nr:16S rRNA (cytosine(1402)-N(4))-methyltransferase RsmH [Flavobacteriales bacterium]HQV74925.1 16S rRNA (cytosine(1402)-N(4))-methyltransferase RsmH [Flavobacteriales bacterium]HQW40877.1 16S rRNA (cytosine(1402)-N(4))-methyltransferase RsmH [Flavobacteriales bacterium]
MANEYHDPVLLSSCLEGLNIRPDGVYVDVTFGGGGHSKAILERLGPKGRLIAFDRDRDAWKNAAALSPTDGGTGDPRFTLVKADFRWFKNHLRYLNALPVDGLLADLGVSSHQFDTGARGFSFRFDGPLDMRMDHRASRTASQLLRDLDEAALTNLLRIYGEVNGAHRVARQLVNANAHTSIATTFQLVEALRPVTPRGRESGFLAQVFQALRIAVNDELGALETLLRLSTDVIAPGGRLVIMSYHSLEDRLVKNWMRSGDLGGEEEKDHFGNRTRPFNPTSNKAIQPTDRETAMNPRARSARLRIATRT